MDIIKIELKFGIIRYLLNKNRGQPDGSLVVKIEQRGCHWHYHHNVRGIMTITYMYSHQQNTSPRSCMAVHYIRPALKQ